MRWAVALSAALMAWLTAQTIVVARHTYLDTDEMAGVALTVVSFGVALYIAILGAVTGFQSIRRRRLATPSLSTSVIAVLVAGLLVCPIGVAPVPPDGARAPVAGQPCDGLAPLPEAIRGRATHRDPRLAYSDGCDFDA
jgi:hypothetical protein